MQDTRDAEQNTILIVDDDITMLEMAGELLGGTYRVSSAKSGQQALEILRRGFTPDIILLDIAMPRMNGYETFEQIKQSPEARDIPVVFLTGLTEAGEELRGLEMGAVDYITKPFVREILLARIKTHLENGKELRRLHGTDRKKKTPEPFAPLTPWEQKIALLAQQRLSAPEIAEKLSITENTVKSALRTIYLKLNIHAKRDLAELDLRENT
jgi:CheY-like chemotaxis protein/DNA-binding CsgD family transcriptional regulator